MLVSAVVDPAAFDARYFNELYAIHAVDFLRGIQRNGLLIVDTGNRLRDSLVTRVKAIPIKYRQQLQILVEELLLKKRSKRIITCFAIPNDTSSGDLLDLAYRLKTDAEADALVVGNKGFEKLISDRRFGEGIVPLSKYRDSDFEKERQGYCDGLGPIDAFSKMDVDKIISRSIRFSKRLRFYDKYIAIADNTSDFLNGIKYILSLWRDHGFFASQRGMGEVEIFTCVEHIREDEEEHVKESKLARSQENYRKVKRGLTEWLKKEAPLWWQVKIFVKDDPDHIFHARYLETQHAIIRVDYGFSLFKQSGDFRRNFFTLNMAESSHLRECRGLPDADL